MDFSPVQWHGGLDSWINFHFFYHYGGAWRDCVRQGRRGGSCIGGGILWPRWNSRGVLWVSFNNWWYWCWLKSITGEVNNRHDMHCLFLLGRWYLGTFGLRGLGDGWTFLRVRVMIGDSHNEGSSYDWIKESKLLKRNELGSRTWWTLEVGNYLHNGANLLLHFIDHRL